MKNKPPIMEGSIPLLFNVHERQVNRFLRSHIINKLYFGFYVLPDARFTFSIVLVV
ncbi:hypothetical protein [Niastella sp. OAS944]|uniref:hypothetical protein n=1 Tax=Niastella sp. OAS944 TaxID=2664089 RepID=UPI0034965C09|nr:hypothetical protein [Chitinophagaceae bacterium OAS944]